MSDAKHLGVLLKWSVFAVPGYIVDSANSESQAEQIETKDENGNTAAISIFNRTKTLTVGGYIKDATVLPEPGDTMSVDEILWIVQSGVQEQRSAGQHVKFTIPLKRYLDNNLPAAA